MKKWKVLTAAVLFTGSTLFAQGQADAQISNTSLSAMATDSHVLLTWNNAGKSVEVFEVERSKNGIDFTVVSHIEPGSYGTEFMESDFSPLEGVSYYRVKMISPEGEITYSNSVPVKYMNGVASSPSSVKSRAGETGSVLIVVRNNSGEEYYSKVQISDETDPLQAVDTESRLSAGTYTIVSCSDHNYYSKRVVVK